MNSLTVCKKPASRMICFLWMGAMVFLLYSSLFAQDETTTNPTPASSSQVEAAEQVLPAAPQLIHDRRIIRSLETEGEKLLQAEKVIPMADLIEQLARTSVTAQLAEPGKNILSAEEIYARNKTGVLVIGALYKCEHCPRWHVAPASGFVISSNGLVVTNYHVVDNNERATLIAMTYDGQIHTVQSVVAASKTDDLAILQLKGDSFSPIPIASNAPIGSEIYVLSHPDRRFYTYTKGMISRYGYVQRNDKPAPMMQIDADYARGSSGGPVFDNKGNVVGVVSSTVSVYYDNENGKRDKLQMVFKQCIPADRILELVEAP